MRVYELHNNLTELIEDGEGDLRVGVEVIRRRGIKPHITIENYGHDIKITSWERK